MLARHVCVHRQSAATGSRVYTAYAKNVPVYFTDEQIFRYTFCAYVQEHAFVMHLCEKASMCLSYISIHTVTAESLC